MLKISFKNLSISFIKKSVAKDGTELLHEKTYSLKKIK